MRINSSKGPRAHTSTVAAVVLKLDSRIRAVSDVCNFKSLNVDRDAGLALLGELNEVRELSTIARVAELRDVLRVGGEGDERNYGGSVVEASKQPSVSIPVAKEIRESSSPVDVDSCSAQRERRALSNSGKPTL